MTTRETGLSEEQREAIIKHLRKYLRELKHAIDLINTGVDQKTKIVQRIRTLTESSRSASLRPANTNTSRGNMSKRILFVLKQGLGSGGSYSTSDLTKDGHSGLFWSSKFVADMLQDAGVEARFVEVFDNTFIDAEITKFNPDIVVIEALWVVPEKFDELQAINPNVRFVVLLHSDTPFLADEMIAVKWLRAYADRGVTLATNSVKMLSDLKTLLSLESDFDKVLYLPDFYPVRHLHSRQKNESMEIDIGCFGAIRSLKNQLIQAIAAIKFANKIGKMLNFHVNASEVDKDGQPILNNLRALFAGTAHTLVEDKWLDHEAFLESLKGIDLGMQVSFTETFDIVAADMVSSGVPTVVSPEVVWASASILALPTDGGMIARKLEEAWFEPTRVVEENHRGLVKFVTESKQIWLHFVGGCE